MAIVLTGATGFVGGHLSRYLMQRGLDVAPLARGVDPTSLLSCAEAVVHLAARVHVMNDTSKDPLTEFRQANVHATELLARQAAASGVRRFVFVSSVKVNGEETPLGYAYKETDEPRPQDAYGISKWEAEVVLRRVAAETGLEVVIVRPPLIYGPGVKANFAALMRAVQRGFPLPFGAIKNARSLVGLDNFVDFLHCCLVHPAAANETFLVSDDHDVSSGQLVKALAQAAGVKPHVLSIPTPVLELGAALVGKRAAVRRLCGSLQVDIAKAKNLLTWAPPVSFADGLERAVTER